MHVLTAYKIAVLKLALPGPGWVIAPPYANGTLG